MGVAVVQVNQRRGLRSHSAREYLRHVARRDTLTVRTRTFVRRVLFDEWRAVGVEYEHRGRRHVALARAEVVLSAGALVSPKMLLVSGVGPRAQLEHHGIGVVHDSPGVGSNLQEHLAIFQRWHCAVPTVNEIGPGDALRSVWEYGRHGTGNLAASVVHVQVVHRTSHERASPTSRVPLPASLSSGTGVRTGS